MKIMKSSFSTSSHCKMNCHKHNRHLSLATSFGESVQVPVAISTKPECLLLLLKSPAFIWGPAFIIDRNIIIFAQNSIQIFIYQQWLITDASTTLFILMLLSATTVAFFILLSTKYSQAVTEKCFVGVCGTRAVLLPSTALVNAVSGLPHTTPQWETCDRFHW